MLTFLNIMKIVGPVVCSRLPRAISVKPFITKRHGASCLGKASRVSRGFTYLPTFTVVKGQYFAKNSI